MFTCFQNIWSHSLMHFNTLRPRQNGRHFPEDIFKWIFLNENVRISIKISLKFVPSVLISNIPTLVQVMAWRRPGDKPLSEPIMVSLLTHICVTRPQWVNHRNTGKTASLHWYGQLVHLAIFSNVFLFKERKSILIKVSLKFQLSGQVMPFRLLNAYPWPQNGSPWCLETKKWQVLQNCFPSSSCRNPSTTSGCQQRDPVDWQPSETEPAQRKNTV